MTAKTATALLLLLGTLRLGLSAEPSFGLDVFRIASNVPVTVTLALEHARQLSPMYQTRDGQWKDLPHKQDGPSIAFTQPADALPEALVLLTRPTWLALPDAEGPVIASVQVDGRAADAGGIVDLGHLAETPQCIRLYASDALNPIAPSRVQARIDGRLPAASGGNAVTAHGRDPKTATVEVTLGRLEIGAHTVSISVADAAPAANSATVTVRFSTAPLLANGGFDDVDPRGAPRHWTTSTWSATPETKAEFTCISEGRTGNALLIRGVAGPLNLVCGQSVDLLPGRTYILSGYYRNDCNAGHASIIAGCNGKQDQYDNMPPLRHSPDWHPFTWEFTTKSDNSDFRLYVRSTSQGNVYFDDLKLEPQL